MRDLLLEIAPERSVERLLRKVVQRLAARPHAVLARLWLLEKGDLCASCPMRPRCPDQTRCLHLVAGAESSFGAPGGDGSLIAVDLDATIVTAHSEKENAAATWKKTFGFHPLAAFADHGGGAGGEALAIVLRPGSGPGRWPASARRAGTGR